MFILLLSFLNFHLCCPYNGSTVVTVRKGKELESCDLIESCDSYVASHMSMADVQLRKSPTLRVSVDSPSLLMVTS